MGRINASQDGKIFDAQGISQCLSAGHGNQTKIAVPVLTPERSEKRQNGRRFKDNDEPMFTLTAQDRHGVMIDIPIDLKIKEATSCNQGVVIHISSDVYDKLKRVPETGSLQLKKGPR